MKNWKLYNPLLVVWDVYVKSTSYIKINFKQLLLFLDSFLSSNKNWRRLRNFYKNKLAYRVHPMSLLSIMMNLKHTKY
jgi:hypothetical protein